MDIRQRYFDWLCIQVNGEDPQQSYIQMLGVLFNHTYRYSMDLDRDRGEDGKTLRCEFLQETYISGDVDETRWMLKPCSVLEMLVALAIRIDRDVLGEGDRCDPTRWFWEMIRNLGIMIPDGYFRGEEDSERIHEIVDRWLSRMYCADGTGGIFPIPGTENDQRETLIWYQMHEYLIKNFM